MNHPVRILVVDDDPDILHGTARLLEKAGYTVDRAASGEEALQAVRKHRPELLLLDHDLPGIDGAEVCRLIKLDPALADTLVVIVSASHAESDQQAEGLESGADGYIGRPIANRELLARVQSYVRIQHQSSWLRLQVEKLDKSNEAVRQAHLASLNLMEDAVAARDQAEQASQALRESELFLSSITCSAHDAILTMDSAGLVSYWNPAAEHIFGYTEAEAIGQNLHSLLAPPRFQAAPQAAFPTFIQTGQGAAVGKTLDLAARRKDGQEITVQLSLSAIQINSDWHAVGILRDITDRKRMESELSVAHQDLEKKVQERTLELATVNETLTMEIVERKSAERVLRESEQRYRTLFAQASIGILILSSDGKLVELNEAFARMHGYSVPEMLLMNLKDFDTPASFQQAPERIRRILAGEVFNFEVENYHKDGHIFPLEVSASLISADGKSFMQCLHRDITEHKRQEEDRIARAGAEKANQAKSIFVANMSHEIRTPLNAVMGFAQVLERDPTLTPEQAEHVRTIHRSGGHLLRLINDILDMSKIEAGRTTLNEAVFCLHDLLDDLLLMFRARAESQGLQLLMERDESVPRNVTADEGKLRQVLVNLLSNAVKFTATGGVAVRVRAAAVAVAGKPGEVKESLRLMVEVEDSGPGIPAEDGERIFDLFQQAGAGVKYGGTGLGLAISRRFVEMMGGELTVKSQMGKGSCFQFDLPLKPVAEFARHEKRVSRRIIGLEPGTGPVRILAVDDAPTNRALLCALLRPLGFEVAEAENGVEALEVFERWSPQAVLMDMRMPVMDGYEATRRLKSTEVGRATPVIALTASAFEDTKERVMATGVDAYVRKPFRMEEICEVLGKHLGLRYVFAGETALAPDPLEAKPLTSESLASLPQEMVVAMRQAVAEGNMARLTELIAQVEKIDSATAHALQALADQYDYEKLNQWLGTS